jgi:hypothetical protein
MATANIGETFRNYAELKGRIERGYTAREQARKGMSEAQRGEILKAEVRELLTPRKQAGQSQLMTRWAAHCAEVGHVRASDGGKATYDTDFGRTYAICCAKGCEWFVILDDTL